ncbi:T9SS type A sorting domain-containing protein [candidate division WOR-3 bacterium]|nr:T9SS type A sorting domain-containing protein [candidate division WOR-3 bacterium]
MRHMIIIFTTIMLGFSTGYEQIPLLKWAGPEGTRPETYEEWIAHHPYKPFEHRVQGVYTGNGEQGTVAIITDNDLYMALVSELSQLVQNLQVDGYTVHSHTVTGGTPEDLKTLLQTLYYGNGIEGTLLIGSVPVAWFEIADDFHGYGYADFPCDLFFMDLDGTWLDTMNTGNNKYDGHSGSITPEIYIGRLYPKGLGNDTLLLRNYFKKDNAFRHDTLLLQQRALVFVDDDWIPWGGWWAENISLLYSDTMNYWDAETTRATVYRAKLDTAQAWVSVFAHSWPQGHQFAYNNGNNYDTYYANEYTSQNPPANYYNFFACSFSRFTETQNCGGNRAIFNQDYGIGSIGSTKTGSMLEFEYFYEPLGQGANLGRAFKDWFTYIAADSVTFDELCWHYGMTLLADCYLIPLGHNTALTEHKETAFPPRVLRLLGNPVGMSVHASITLPSASQVEVSLYGLDGSKLMCDYYHMNTGTHSFTVNLVDRNGNALPNGVYVLRVSMDRETFTEKVVKIE